MPTNILIMKVGPHSNMSLAEIIQSKQEEELVHGVHYWGYSGVFCQPKPTQFFCQKCLSDRGVPPSLVLLETKSRYNSTIGEIKSYSRNGTEYYNFKEPVQLQGAQFSFVCKKIRIYNNFNPNYYKVVGGKNDGKPLLEHLRYRINKSFATIDDHKSIKLSNDNTNNYSVIIADLVEPFALWLKE